MFSFTLRRAENTNLGLGVSHHEFDKVLCVESVRAGGAIEAWNRQCLNSPNPERAVMTGDRIISVNAVSYDPDQMLEECQKNQLLHLTFCRGEGPLPMPPQGTGSTPLKPTLRANASEFVPSAASVSEAPSAHPGASDTQAKAGSLPAEETPSEASGAGNT